MIGVLSLVAIFGLPGLALLAASVGNGARRWPWPEGVVATLAVGVAGAGISGVVLGVLGVFSLATELAAVTAIALVIVAAGRFRVAWPFTVSTRLEAATFVLVAVVASAVFLNRPFEMLLGGRDASVYLVTGVGLSRGGSLLLEDHVPAKIGPEATRLFYPPGRENKKAKSFFHRLGWVKYPGFYYTDVEQGRIIGHGLPLLPALIAIFHAAFGLEGAFAANPAIGVLAVAAVAAAGMRLCGGSAALVGAGLLSLNLVEVWAARYPVAEILFQMLLWSSLAALLREDRGGDRVAGILLATSLFARVEALVAVFLFVGWDLVTRVWRRPVLGSDFWFPFIGIALAASASALALQPSYVYMAWRIFWRFEGQLVHAVAARPHVVAMIAAGVIVAFFAARAWRRATGSTLDVLFARLLAVAVPILAVGALWIRPHHRWFLGGQLDTVVWLSWYVATPIFLVAMAGLAHHLWSRANGRLVLATVVPLVLGSIFLHHMFAKLHHIYLTRRFVPATVPLVFLFFGYAVATIAARRGRLAIPAVGVAALIVAAATATIVDRSRHIYAHREYEGLSDDLGALAERLAAADIVLVADNTTRDLLGAALEFVYGVPTLIARPARLQAARTEIRDWIHERGWKVAAIARDHELERFAGGQELELVERFPVRLHVLAEVFDEFPTAVTEAVIDVERYAGGAGSDPLYAYWVERGDRLAAAVCPTGARLVGGDRFLAPRVRARCERSGAGAGAPAYLVETAGAAGWQAWLAAFGARFDGHDLGDAILFADVLPPRLEGAAPLPRDRWRLAATSGQESTRLAVDGSLDTRWGSGAPQAPEMSFTVEFPEPVDVAWVRIRTGKFPHDQARALAWETSPDGVTWERHEVPLTLGGLRWENGAPVIDRNGDLDLWLDRRKVRFLRLVNLGQHPRFDWSIAELEIEGRMAGTEESGA